MIKKLIAAIALVGVFTLTGCSDDADVASENLSKAADNFEIQRQIVFFNGSKTWPLLKLVADDIGGHHTFSKQ